MERRCGAQGAGREEKGAVFIPDDKLYARLKFAGQYLSLNLYLVYLMPYVLLKVHLNVLKDI